MRALVLNTAAVLGLLLFVATCVRLAITALKGAL